MNARKFAPQLSQAERDHLTKVIRDLRRMGVFLPAAVRKAMRDDVARSRVVK